MKIATSDTSNGQLDVLSSQLYGVARNFDIRIRFVVDNKFGLSIV
jgi:hypothetical protein